MYLQKLRGRAFVLFLTLGSVSAAEPQKTVELTERVITATRTETERWRTASSVTVIDRKKIDEQQLKLLPDALRQVPGLVIADRGTPGSTVGRARSSARKSPVSQMGPTTSTGPAGRPAGTTSTISWCAL